MCVRVYMSSLSLSFSKLTAASSLLHTHTAPAALALKLLHPLLQPLIGNHQTRRCLVILGLGPAQQRIPHAGIWRCSLPTKVLGLGFRLKQAALPPRLGPNIILPKQQGNPFAIQAGWHKGATYLPRLPFALPCPATSTDTITTAPGAAAPMRALACQMSTHLPLCRCSETRT